MTPEEPQDQAGEPRRLLRDWVRIALEALAAKRAEIDALNVFPVPDGDTGTNVYLTMESSAVAVEEAFADPQASRAQVAIAMARGALLGARGNSGVILSQVLKGVTDVIAELGDAPIVGTDVSRMLQRGTELAYAAVAAPVEGTILTVSREAAAAAHRAAEAGRGVVSVLQSAAEAAEETLDATPQMLEALRRAGVVDAGGRALVVVLDALVDAATGTRTALHRPSFLRGPAPAMPQPCAGADYDGPAYEVMHLLDIDSGIELTDAHARIETLRTELGALGDSLVVVGDEKTRTWNVHVHVDEPGTAIQAALRAGSPRDIRVTYLLASRGDADAAADDATTDDDVVAARALVAVAHGPGVAELLAAAGVGVVHAEAGVRPAAGELLAVAQSTAASEVVLLPSDKDTNQSAEVAASELRATGVRAAVIPTRSVVQTLAAVAVHDPDAGYEDDVVAMTRAASSTRYGAVTVASRSALTSAGQCELGDVLGLMNGDIAVIGTDVTAVARTVIDALLAAGGELATLVFGADADDALRMALSAWLQQMHPAVETVIVDGGQPLWPVIVGVE